MGIFSSIAFVNRFREYSRRRRLFDDRSKVIVAVSGGVDSMVLLDLFAKERQSAGLMVICAHFNHQLRGTESEGDEEHVARRAQLYGIELYVERAPTAEYAKHHKLGIQEAARNLRYEFFEKLLISSGYDRIATAHNADDNAETVLLNVFRGAGVQGLSGIPVWRPDRKIIRPMLFAQRTDIEQYATAEQVEYRNDSSNDTDHYTRNFIRHHIIPHIKEQVNPNLVRTLHRSAELFRELEVYLIHNASQILDLIVTARTQNELHVSIPRLRSNPALLQQYAILLAAEEFTGKKLEFENVHSVLRLAEGLTGSWLSLSGDSVVYRDRDELVLRRTDQVSDFRIIIQPNHRYEFSRFRFSSELLQNGGVTPSGTGTEEYVDADRIQSPELVLRTWGDGDAFVPLGMTAKKKISDYFVDAKIPVYEKRNFPILETRDGEVVWVCGQRIDDRFKITSATKRVLKLEFSRPSQKVNDRTNSR